MKNLQPVRLENAYREGADLESMTPWPKAMQLRTIATHRYKTWYDGEKLTSMVYEADDGLLQFTDLPYDEHVCVLNGTAILTSEDGERHVYTKGDVFIAPKGWTGTWELKDGYRELITFEKQSLIDAMEKWGLE